MMVSTLAWTSVVQEGDRLRAADYVTGSVEIRQLRSVYKLSFTDIARVNRFKPAGAPELGASDEESNESLAKAKRDERGKSTVRLYVFLTKKKAKTRMADLEETAFLLRLDVGTEGCICFGKSFGTFDQVLQRRLSICRYRSHFCMRGRPQRSGCGSYCRTHMVLLLSCFVR